MIVSSGLLLPLQRLSTEDGPGIRTTVFFKGCPLRCAWCHNPEGLSSRPQVQWLENRCIACQTCLGSCPKGAVSKIGATIRLDRQRCDGCGLCVSACPSNALELLGRWVSLDDLLADLLKDRAYYEKSGGGVTLSGGEPTLQAPFAEELLHQLKIAGISTAFDTCGWCSPQTLEPLLAWVDLVLFDIKLLDPARHKRFTGQDNGLVLDNLRRLISSGKRIWIRTPLIPEITASCENITAIGSFLAEFAGGFERWELCAFNNLCRDKYRRLELDWPFVKTPLLTSQTLAEIEARAAASGIDPAKIFMTGMTRRET